MHPPVGGARFSRGHQLQSGRARHLVQLVTGWLSELRQGMPSPMAKGRTKMGASDARLDDIARSAQILLSDRKKGGLYTAEQEAILNVRLFCVQFLTKVHKIVSMAYV